MKKIISVFLSIIILCSFVLPLTAAAVENVEASYAPSIVIPGVFQSDVRYYDENGNEVLKADGTSYERPFFLDNTDEIVKMAVKKALWPVSKMLITQSAKDRLAAQAVADVLGQVLLGKLGVDSSGNFINQIRAVEYNTSAANLSEYDRDFLLDAIPLYDYVDIAGADHLYFFSYVSFDNIQRLAQQLYDLIQIAKEECGASKVNIVPISQGGTLFVALMQLYKDKGLNIADDVHRVCFIVPAADGTAILGDIFHYGLLDDNDALYGYLIPSLLKEEKEWIGYLADILLRMMPNANANAILDMAVKTLINDYLKYSTCMWALLPSADYPACREMYLSGEADAFIREQTDWYYAAQTGAKNNILEAQAQGVEFFDIVDYNVPLYKICDSWDKVNADGVIHTDSESFGATTGYVDTPLPEDYVQANTYCTDPTHNHMDEMRIVDASTGVLCESTFYFKGQHHESSAANDVIIRLATRILTDDTFTDVHSDPAYPQFNFGRHSRKLKNLYKKWIDKDVSDLPAAQQAELAEALSEAEAALASTVMPTEEFTAVYEKLSTLTYTIENGSAPKSKVTRFIAFLTRVFKKFSEFLLKNFGGKGFSDILLFRNV
ncbi:MAG: hypothetical protein IJT27_04050 [Clostridia bacterium]|nr:hypothetical protein [Clostridia bacterium]